MILKSFGLDWMTIFHRNLTWGGESKSETWDGQPIETFKLNLNFINSHLIQLKISFNAHTFKVGSSKVIQPQILNEKENTIRIEHEIKLLTRQTISIRCYGQTTKEPIRILLTIQNTSWLISNEHQNWITIINYSVELALTADKLTSWILWRISYFSTMD